MRVSPEIENPSNFLMLLQILRNEPILGTTGACSFFVLYYSSREGVGLGLEALDTN